MCESIFAHIIGHRMSVVGRAMIVNMLKRIAHMLDVKRPKLPSCMCHEEIPPLKCEDAPRWLCLVQSRGDEVTTEFCCATNLHDLPRIV